MMSGIAGADNSLLEVSPTTAKKTYGQKKEKKVSLIPVYKKEKTCCYGSGSVIQ